jgi:hypothetical protein
MLCADKSSYQQRNGILVVTPKEMNYYKGFTVQTLGGNPPFTFFNSSVPFGVKVITSSSVKPWIEPGNLSLEANGDIKHLLRVVPVSVVEIRSNGVDITVHTQLSGNYILFDKEYTNIIISYTTIIYDHFIKFFATPESIITMVVNGSEYPLEGFNKDMTGDAPCILGSTVPVNIYEELGVQPFEALYKTVIVTYPDGSDLTTTTDPFGMIYIPNIQFGDHLINVNQVNNMSRMILISGAKEQ